MKLMGGKLHFPGDRLISVNDISLEGLPHESAVKILQNTPDDVALVVSQPTERLYEGIILHTACCSFVLTADVLTLCSI